MASKTFEIRRQQISLNNLETELTEWGQKGWQLVQLEPVAPLMNFRWALFQREAAK